MLRSEFLTSILVMLGFGKLFPSLIRADTGFAGWSVDPNTPRSTIQRNETYNPDIRGGQIWAQEGFPNFSVMLVLMGYDRGKKDTMWIMIRDPRRQVGNMAIRWDHRTIWTGADLEAFLARDVPFVYQGQLYDLLIEEASPS